jgi:hypothetical protein
MCCRAFGKQVDIITNFLKEPVPNENQQTVAGILAQGKREPSLRLHMAAPEPMPTPPDPREYQAVRLGRKPPRLRIRTHTGPGHSLPYGGLLDVITDDEFGKSLALVYHHQVVKVTGHHLGAVADAINDHRAAVMTAYNPQAFHVPQNGTCQRL